jgi:hypothetical protein
MKLNNLLTIVGMLRWVIEENALVYHTSLAIVNVAEVSFTRLQFVLIQISADCVLRVILIIFWQVMI